MKELAGAAEVESRSDAAVETSRHPISPPGDRLMIAGDFPVTRVG
jgi:hypothetical protein